MFVCRVGLGCWVLMVVLSIGVGIGVGRQYWCWCWVLLLVSGKADLSDRQTHPPVDPPLGPSEHSFWTPNCAPPFDPPFDPRTLGEGGSEFVLRAVGDQPFWTTICTQGSRGTNHIGPQFVFRAARDQPFWTTICTQGSRGTNHIGPQFVLRAARDQPFWTSQDPRYSK